MFRPGPTEWDGDAFVDACAGGRGASVVHMTSEFFLDAHADADLNATDFGGRTWTGFASACLNGHIAVVRHLASPRLRAAGLDVNRRGAWGLTPLHAAAMGGHCEVVEFLCSPEMREAGIDVNAVSKAGMTALMLACACEGSRATMAVRALAQARLPDGRHSVDMSVRDRSGRTALMTALANKARCGADMVDILRDAMRLPAERAWLLGVRVIAREEARSARADAKARSTCTGEFAARPEGTLGATHNGTADPASAAACAPCRRGPGGVRRPTTGVAAAVATPSAAGPLGAGTVLADARTRSRRAVIGAMPLPALKTVAAMV